MKKLIILFSIIYLISCQSKVEKYKPVYSEIDDEYHNTLLILKGELHGDRYSSGSINSILLYENKDSNKTRFLFTYVNQVTWDTKDKGLSCTDYSVNSDYLVIKNGIFIYSDKYFTDKKTFFAKYHRTNSDGTIINLWECYGNTTNLSKIKKLK